MTDSEMIVTCPICGETARKGFVRSFGRTNSIEWHPGEPTWKNRFKSGFSDRGIRLDNFGGLFGTWADAIYCKSCQRVILEVTDMRKRFYPYLKE